MLEQLNNAQAIVFKRNCENISKKITEYELERYKFFNLNFFFSFLFTKLKLNMCLLLSTCIKTLLSSVHVDNLSIISCFSVENKIGFFPVVKEQLW